MGLPIDLKRQVEQLSTSNIFLCPEWFDLLSRHCVQQPDHAQIYHYGIGEESAILPVILQGKRRGYARSLTNFYTPFFYPLFSSDRALAMLCEQMFIERGIEKLDLEPLPGGARLEALEQALGQVGYAVFPYFRFGNWFMHTKGRSFEDYYRDRSGQLKNTIKRKRQKLTHRYGFKHQIFTDEADQEAAKRVYWQVYNKSWKQKEPFPAFISGLIDLAAAKGWMRLAVLYAGDEPIAVQLWLVAGGVASIYKLAYDERFREFSPGSVLSYEMFRHVIDHDRVTEIDYLVGDEPYKKDWMEARRERWGLVAFNQGTLMGRSLAAIERIKRVLRPVRASNP